VVLQQQLGQRDAPPLPAAEHVDGGVRRGAAQRVHGALLHTLDLPQVTGIDLKTRMDVRARV